ncbi:AbfB domain-containing protein [Streptomyces sp. NPDC005423]|uniref:AbfB domain-containing protein n=1 Tax=Streptomyces sp. NPDC005423 TaxID=3155343 RepID=UPI0033AEED11
MPDSTSQPPENGPWENDWSPDTSPTPGTRRLYLAAALAVATIAACGTAIFLNDKAVDATSDGSRNTTAPVDTDGPGLLSFASPSKKTSAPAHRPSTAGRSGSAPSSPSASPEHGSGASAKAPAPTKSSSSHRSSSGSSGSSSDSSADWQAIRSVNYPDRYWQVTGGLVKLDPVDSPSARNNAGFEVVKGLADSSCYSFTTAGGAYLRHRDFILRAERDDGSSFFKGDATFCPRPSAYSGAVMLESVNYPGRFLRHRNFQLELDPYQDNGLYRADSAFRLVDAVA